ncbi:hypothetical protein NKR23_g8541 [Pleurostoma richardsiae]|uniref:Mitochondrial import inner membrane translocase subunit TIM54 n=1 Tax=Pleurostoma richardsiae TaxID=41990 RepID=A0AA38RT84_9PEZI|nr:hypothetical protein NKR23_g8541 [Pleurostoma richardsiae]
MADSQAAPAAPPPGSATYTAPKPPPGNSALRMLGLPTLPRKLPSRNWMIFWALTASISGAIIYDRREKRRATARWAKAVSHLAAEPIPSPSALPRRLTVYLEAPPGDGLRVAQDHFTEYVKPVLAASGLDWEFVQGRREGDVRAVVAERVRRARRATEADIGAGTDAGAQEQQPPTGDEMVEQWRRKNNIPEYEGVRGDVVVGRHTWKEYVRGLHEGWLGPLTAPPEPQQPAEASETKEGETEKKDEEDKPKRPPQPKPYNTVESYPTSHLPLLIPSELGPSAPVPFPHILGFLNTPTRLRRFLTRRYLADQIGREVAAVCLCTYREFREADSVSTNVDAEWEQQLVLAHEEKDWVKSVWKEAAADDAKPTTGPGDGEGAAPRSDVTERIWAKPVVVDTRIGMRMRRFEILPEDEDRARKIVVPEEEIEGWIKGSLRQAWRWGAKKYSGEEKKQIPLDDEE